MGLYKVLTRNFSSRNRQQVSTLAAGIALILNIGLNVILIPRWGVAGASLASTVGYTVAGGILLIFFLADAKLSWREVLLPKRKELVGHLYWVKERIQGQRRRVKVW